MKAIEWLASLIGLLGALLLALHNEISGWGFVAFLLSNILWIVWGVRKRAHGLLTMQIGFTVTSLMGIINWMP